MCVPRMPSKDERVRTGGGDKNESRRREITEASDCTQFDAAGYTLVTIMEPVHHDVDTGVLPP